MIQLVGIHAQPPDSSTFRGSVAWDVFFFFGPLCVADP